MGNLSSSSHSVTIQTGLAGMNMLKQAIAQSKVSQPVVPAGKGIMEMIQDSANVVKYKGPKPTQDTSMWTREDWARHREERRLQMKRRQEGDVENAQEMDNIGWDLTKITDMMESMGVAPIDGNLLLEQKIAEKLKAYHDTWDSYETWAARRKMFKELGKGLMPMAMPELPRQKTWEELNMERMRIEYNKHMTKLFRRIPSPGFRINIDALPKPDLNELSRKLLLSPGEATKLMADAGAPFFEPVPRGIYAVPPEMNPPMFHYFHPVNNPGYDSFGNPIK